MIRRLAPRRLGSDEEATVVEHLTELRHRLLIVIAAIIPAFLLTFAFHTQLIEWLMRPLPSDKTLVTLGVTEPFTTAVKVSLLAAIAIVLPILIWQVWGFLAPAVDQATQRVLSLFIVIATALFVAGVVFAYFVVLPAAISFLTNFDDTLYDVQIRASYYLSFTSLVLLASGLAFEMPIFILALVRIRILSYDRLRRNRRIGYALMVCFAILLPTVDPVSLLFEVIPLLILFEASIWLSRVMEKRWNRGLPAESRWGPTADEDGDDTPDEPEDWKDVDDLGEHDGDVEPGGTGDLAADETELDEDDLDDLELDPDEDDFDQDDLDDVELDPDEVDPDELDPDEVGEPEDRKP